MSRASHTNATLGAANDATTSVRTRRAFIGCVSSSFSGTAKIILKDEAGTEHTLYDGTAEYSITGTINTVVELPCIMGVSVKCTAYTSGSLAVTVQSDTMDAP